MASTCLGSVGHERPGRTCGEAVAGALGLVALALLTLSHGSPFTRPDAGSAHRAAQILHELQLEARQAERQAAAQRRLGSAPGAELTGGARGLSPRPLFDQIIERYGSPRRQHRQPYGRGRSDRRLNGDTLSAANTEPIRFHLNFDTLDRDKVQANPLLRDRYCFEEGAWYRIGHPQGPKPSGAGPDDCSREAAGLAITHEDKWCLCMANDVITPDLRRLVVEATKRAVADVPKYLRVRPVQGKLTFQKSEGSYLGMWAQTNQQGTYCDADCVKGSHVVVPEVLCEGGVDSDVVLSVAVPPAVPGVGGTGGFCSSDQNGRPLHLVFNWHKRPDPALGTAFEDLVTNSRGLVLHEVLHGLGFGTGLWRNSFGSSGERRKILEQRRVVDSDGSEDVVYHFVKGTRTYEAAKAYFGCSDEDLWQGLPLMGWPSHGRDSHHETRIMRDDVMSYGDGDAISGITLATFEDTGHYVANYSNADCIHWGQGRGCAFVASRCEQRPSAQIVTGLAATSNCERTWPAATSDDSRAALAKCAPSCSGSSRLEGGRSTCDLECFTGSAADVAAAGFVGCASRPTGDVSSAGPEAWAQNLASKALGVEQCLESLDSDGCTESLVDLAWLILIPINVLCWGLCFKRLLCPAGRQARSKQIFYLLTSLVLLGGLAAVGGGGYVMYNYEAIRGYVSALTVWMVMAAGLFTACLASFGIYAVAKGHRCKMIIYLLVGSLSLVIFICAAGLFAKYAQDMDGLSRSSLAQVGEAGGGAWASRDGVEQDIYAHMESFACRTYQTCCEPSALFDIRAANGAPRQCKSQHEGAMEDAAFVLSDPSHPMFCPMISGVDQRLGSDKGVCHLIELAAGGGFTLDQCRQDYCASGLEGYENFISVTVSIYRKNMRIAGVIAGCVVIFMSVQLINLYYICRQTRKDATVQPIYSPKDQTQRSQVTQVQVRAVHASDR